MKLYKETITLQSEGDTPSYIDVTPQVREVIKESGIKEGLVTVISPHTTCAVFFEEFSHDRDSNGDEYLQIDLNEALEKIIPKHTSASTYHYPGEEHYKEVEKWPNIEEYLPGGDRSYLWNGDAHLKSTIIGSSEVFDVTDYTLGVGKTGYIYFVDFDVTRPRERRCLITVMGE
ncbi:YjbQ family protein [Alkalibacterium iburiense]|uniref:YjbQ family protein n=1 Tax=Alkalibacterium iburiense TaxID=290589 RepID=A0ABN0WZA4_9LACT